jgi:hypothetical protein
MLVLATNTVEMNTPCTPDSLADVKYSFSVEVWEVLLPGLVGSNYQRRQGRGWGLGIGRPNAELPGLEYEGSSRKPWSMFKIKGMFQFIDQYFAFANSLGYMPLP